jgi:hypothetical protein
MAIERRNYQRYCARDNAFAVIGPEPVTLAPVIDISLGGLGMGVNGFNPRAEELDFPPNQGIYGVKFVDLMSSQQTQLKYFIRNHTRGAMTPKFIRKFNQHFHQLSGKRGLASSCQSAWLQRPSL